MSFPILICGICYSHYALLQPTTFPDKSILVLTTYASHVLILPTSGTGPVSTAAYDPHQPPHTIATATAINSSHSLNDINLSIAMDNADRNAFAALYGPSQGPGIKSTATTSTSEHRPSIPLSSSLSQSQSNETNNNSSKNTNTISSTGVFIPPPPQPSSSVASLDSSSSLSQHASSSTPLLPTTHIDADID